MSTQLILTLLLITNSAQANQATPTASVAASPAVSASQASSQASSVSPAPSAVPSGAPAVGLSAPEKKSLIKEFKKAQASEERAFIHTRKSQERELAAAQGQRKKQWLDREKRERHEFFKAHMNGPERRQYVMAYIKKKKDFDQSLKDEWAHAKKSWAERFERLKVKQKQQFSLFKAKVDQGERPDASLWPN